MTSDVDQNDLSTVKGSIAPGVEDAPFYLVPAADCEFCEGGQCRACYKCCQCELCDAVRTHKNLYVCDACGCRVWFTGCSLSVCLCLPQCECQRCCTEAWDGHYWNVEIARLQYSAIERAIETALAELSAAHRVLTDRPVVHYPSEEASEFDRTRARILTLLGKYTLAMSVLKTREALFADATHNLEWSNVSEEALRLFPRAYAVKCSHAHSLSYERCLECGGERRADQQWGEL